MAPPFFFAAFFLLALLFAVAFALFAAFTAFCLHTRMVWTIGQSECAWNIRSIAVCVDYSCRGGGIMRTFEIPALTTGASASFLAGAFEAFLAGISSLRAARGNAVEQGWLEVGGAVHAPR